MKKFIGWMLAFIVIGGVIYLFTLPWATNMMNTLQTWWSNEQKQTEQKHAEQQNPESGQPVTYETIQQLMSAGKFEEAIQACNVLLKRDQQDVNAWNMKGIALASIKKFGDALNCFNQALRIAPKAAGFWANKGMALAALNRYEEAFDSYNNAVLIDPQKAGAWSGRGSCLEALGKYFEAIESYDRALEIEPDRSWIFSNKITLLDNLVEKVGQTKVNQFLSLPATKPAEYFNKGYVLLLLEQYDACAQNFKKLVRLEPHGINTFMLAVETG